MLVCVCDNVSCVSINGICVVIRASIPCSLRVRSECTMYNIERILLHAYNYFLIFIQ